MVPLPLFKLASLFVRHVSKYGANRIKIQAHDHPGFRKFAARYGQAIHQLNMRLNVALLRNIEAERIAKEKAEAPTVKTKEETEKDIKKEESVKSQAHGTTKESTKTTLRPSIWKRKFRPLPEAKAIDLFADVIGDGFILLVASSIIIYEYWRSSQKPDANLEKIRQLEEELEGLKKVEAEHLEEERRRESRILAMEAALRNYRDPKTKQPLLPSATPIPAS